MRRQLLSMFVVACAGLVPSFVAVDQAAAIPAVSISGGNVLSDGDTNGWRFQALQNFQVTSLGTWDEGNDGLPAAVSVGLWTDSGTLLASISVPAGVGGTLDNGFRYASILPISLSAGTFYRVGSSANSGNVQYREGVVVTENPAIDYDDGFFAGSVNTLTFPNNPGALANFPDFFGANFQIGAAVPEPATAALAFVGLAGLAMRRRRNA